MKEIKRKPRVLLIDPPDYQNASKGNLQLPLGLIALHNHVTKNDLVDEAKIIDLSLLHLQTKNINDKAPIKLLKNSGVLNKNWNVIGITTHYTNTLTSIAIAKYLKRIYPKALIVFGGIHATSCHQSLLKGFPHIDLVILGEGELGLGAICNAVLMSDYDHIDLSKIPNAAHINKDGDVIVTLNQYLQLDKIGPYDFSCVDVRSYVQSSRTDSFWVESGRGCVFKCGFCISAKHWGYRSRYFSADKIANDLLFLREAGITKVKLTHDQFSCNKKKVREICHAILEKNLRIEWGCYSRASEFPFEELDIMAEAGCRQIFVGVESQAAPIQEAIKKQVPTARLETIMDACKSRNIEVETNVILGFPEHTETRILDEIAFCAELKKKSFGRVSISPLDLYPSTSFYHDKKYRDLFFLKSPRQEIFEELYSFQFEFKRKFWGLPIKVLAECARVWTTYFPATLSQILGDSDGYRQFGEWISKNRENLRNIHGSEDLGCFGQFLDLAILFWANDSKITDLLLAEGAMALIAIGWPSPYRWSSPNTDSMIYFDGEKALVKARVQFDEEGRLSLGNGHYYQIKIYDCNQDLVIENNRAA